MYRQSTPKFFLLLFLLIAAVIEAQELPPIFKETPRQLLPAATVANFPQKTFLENLVALPDGSLLVNSHYEGIVYKVSASGDVKKFATVNGKVTGIAPYGKDKFVLTGNDQQDKAVLYLLDATGNMTTLLSLPDAVFVNGITHWKEDTYFIADSYKGCIWKANAKTGEVSNWLEDDLLKRASEQNPTPGANGLHVRGNTLYVSNTQKQTMLQVKLVNGKLQKPTVFVSGVNVDDFSIDAAGNIWATTHIYNSVIKIAPDKQVTVVAEQSQGASGSTATALYSVASTGKTKLYVSTNGGMSYPPAGGLEASKIIALTIN